MVHLVFLNLLKGWQQLMEKESPAASAWAHLKETVEEVLIAQSRTSAMPETALAGKVSRSVLEGVRDKFAAVESTVGLYHAISRLPDRQFEVMVLRVVLGYTQAETARIMGITEATVRSHRYLARLRLAQELGIKLGTEKE